MVIREMIFISKIWVTELRSPRGFANNNQIRRYKFPAPLQAVQRTALRQCIRTQRQSPANTRTLSHHEQPNTVRRSRFYAVLWEEAWSNGKIHDLGNQEASGPSAEQLSTTGEVTLTSWAAVCFALKIPCVHLCLCIYPTVLQLSVYTSF